MTLRLWRHLTTDPASPVCPLPPPFSPAVHFSPSVAIQLNTAVLCVQTTAAPQDTARCAELIQLHSWVATLSTSAKPDQVDIFGVNFRKLFLFYWEL